MEKEQPMRENSILNCFYPLEGFEDRVHGRHSQEHLGDPNTESLVDMCCWVEHKHLYQLHNSFPEILKEKIH